MTAEDMQGEFQLDSEQLYQEDVFTDRRVGSILRLTPVSADGAQDHNRSVVYLGQTQVLTQAGALPINFEIEAVSLKEAVERFDDGAQKAVDETMEQLKQLQREAASSIVVPGAGGTGQSALGGGGLLGGKGNRLR